jgi:hypothetical protein
MPDAPNPTPIFHITAIDNLASIARAGELLSKARMAAQGLSAADIAYQHIQGRRALREISIAPGGTLHDYVPFYFAPRSPMLFTINQGNVPNCNYRQDDIVHLVSTAQQIRILTRPFVFSDIHAALDYARFFGDLAELNEIEWQIFFEEPRRDGYCIYWQNRHTPAHHVRRRETRQAEFLVHECVPLAAISEVCVRTTACESRVRAALAGTGWNPTIRVVAGWYF